MTSLLDGMEAAVQRELAAQAPRTMRPAPPPGVYPQVWLGQIKGTQRERERALAAFCARAASLPGGIVPGIVLHAFPRGLAATWPRWQRIVADAGLLALASWGLDGRKDDDGTPLTAAEKGTLCGEVLARADCAAGYLDAEGQWDTDQGPLDDMDEAGALAFGRALRAVAPTAWVGDQPWPIIDVHGDVRRGARPVDQGGCFAGFPIDEFAASCVNGDRARQLYWENFTRQWGRDAYERMSAWMERSWGVVRPALDRAGLTRTEAVSIQGYAHKDTVDTVDCILDWGINRATRVVVWSEPFPTEVTMRAIAAAGRLRELGHAGPGVAPRQAVRAAQRGAGITADGLCGEKTCRALGLA